MKFGIRGQLTDAITCFKFLVNRFRGCGVLTPQKLPFPIDLLCRPYNSVHVTTTGFDSSWLPASLAFVDLRDGRPVCVVRILLSIDVWALGLIPPQRLRFLFGPKARRDFQSPPYLFDRVWQDNLGESASRNPLVEIRPVKTTITSLPLLRLVRLSFCPFLVLLVDFIFYSTIERIAKSVANEC